MAADLAWFGKPVPNPLGKPVLRDRAPGLVSRLADMVGEGHLSDEDADVIRYLAGRPAEKRTVTCPICRGFTWDGVFTAETDEELFAMVANHTMSHHNGGPVDAFCTAESVLPVVGAAYRKDAAERPWLYQPARKDDGT